MELDIYFRSSAPLSLSMSKLVVLFVQEVHHIIYAQHRHNVLDGGARNEWSQMMIRQISFA